MYISHKHKIAFIAIAKNASRTIGEFLQDTAEAVTVGRHHGYGHGNNKKIKDYQAFVVVRNPYSRLVSRWSSYLKSKKTTIKSFANYIRVNEKEKLEQQIRPGGNCVFPSIQARVLEKAQQLFDKPILILRYENLKDEWVTLGLPGTASDFPSDLHRGKGDYGSWKKFYKKNWMKRKVSALYQEDFELFGYDENI